MNLQPVTLEHGERFGKLTVLSRVKNSRGQWRYVCGCECGYPEVRARAAQLMKGKMKSCLKCRAAA